MSRYDDIQRRRLMKRRRRRTLLVALLLLLIGGIGYGAYTSFDFLSSLTNIYSGAQREKSKLRTESVEITKKPFSVLIMGVENYAGGEKGRTDSIMFAVINPTTKQVKLLSIPRDTRVMLPGRTEASKINAAHAIGGESMTINAVEDLLKVPVDHYVKLDFEGFKQIVDAVGGVEVDIPFDFEEHSDVDYGKMISFKKGRHTLNGEEALAYVRMRKQDPLGDHGRTQRQRQVLAAVVHKMNSPSVVPRINKIAKAVGNAVKTDIPLTDGLALYNKLSGLDTSAMQTVTLEGEDKRVGGLFYFLPSAESQKKVHDELWSALEMPEAAATKP
ncbi:LCP family protein [Ectobacillus ponti]|uniref:LCP family protein n=1 Tax=Ectobacillus ponti TaxID=2961894 RepID=A0AA42BPK3_9BACI|nr:LCP family protein [Ectobacillus ponti]MCP8967629.1 LCP family protein [Ectobacillus ponti]